MTTQGIWPKWNFRKECNALRSTAMTENGLNEQSAVKVRKNSTREGLFRSRSEILEFSDGTQVSIKTRARKKECNITVINKGIVFPYLESSKVTTTRYSIGNPDDGKFNREVLTEKTWIEQSKDYTPTKLRNTSSIKSENVAYPELPPE